MPPSLSIAIPLHDFALGGTERIAVRLAGAWARAGARVLILCTDEAGPLRALLDPRVDIIAVGRGGRGTIGRWSFARAVRRRVARLAVDIVFIPGNFHWPVARAVAGRGVAVVAQVSAALDKPQRGRMRQMAFAVITRARLERIDAAVALSTLAAHQIDRILGRKIARAIALPALDDDAPPPCAVPPGVPLVMAAGRLVPEKGFDTLIRAFAVLPDRAARLRIVGAGPDEARLRGLAIEFGIADLVELPGFADSIRPHLDAARLFVLSSQFEGFPAVLVEALGAGRQVVATACTPATALLADAGGRVVPIDDAAAMSEAIGALLAMPPPDPQALADRVAAHRIGAVARAYLDLFDQLRGAP